MRFAEPFWLFGAGLALVVAALFVAGGVLLLRSVRRFGDETLVLGLVTGRPGVRRALKAGLLVAAVALAFLALAKPQYGRGTRLIPATNLDVVVVLDYSKSMHARDIAPSRTQRAKADVARLIGDLPGARFGAVAFAGQPMAFPLTSDGPAIAQFFRQLSPNDMPVGGTAIARALEAARDEFARDPLSKKHEKVILLVTDGEDLEGDPVAVAKSAAADDISIHVVQVGGRTPEPIPEVNELGQAKGFRTDSQGNPLTTSLSAAGEEQLTEIANVTGGQIVRSESGKTGIDVIAAKLRGLMTEELSERVETVYADVYHYPLLLALLLLAIETFVNETAPRARASKLPPPMRKRRRKTRAKTLEAATLGLLVAATVALACSKERKSVFDRHAPPVDDAIAALDAGDAGAAVALLETYLSTGKCEKGEIGVPEAVRTRPNASFDLGLGLFRLAEQYGKRFGEEAPATDAGAPGEEELIEKRSAEVDCALRIVRTVAADASIPVDLRARALYLAGNLDFLRGDYRTAVKSYDSALKLTPGLPPDAGDTIGSDAAHNRAIALRRIQEEDEQKDEQPDAGEPDAGEPDAGEPDAGDEQNDAGDQQDDAGAPEEEPDAGEPDAGDQKQDEPRDQPEQPDGGAPEQQPPPPQQSRGANQDERILEQLENAPTVQEHDAKNRALQGRVPGMEDK